MKKPMHSRRAVARACLLLLVAGSAHAQVQSLNPVTVTGQAFPPAADVTGFGDLPLRDVPVSAAVIDSRTIEQSGARRLADLTRFDPSMADAYDAPGYWDQVSVRGFVLDNDYNFRREGLPLNAETPIPLENKQRVEILRGTSGMQAGVSAPGGLVNFVVKRPTDFDLRQVRVEASQRATLLGAVDLGGRFGTDGVFGYRLNAAHEQLRPLVNNLDGRRSLFALAGDWKLPNGALLEGEMEWSRKVQPSQVAFSLLGAALPAVPDLRLNLNNQPWTPPTRFDALTGTLRYTQPLGKDWKLSLQAGTQRLTNDDYTAFPFGCTRPGEVQFDRFCSTGEFDLYDYRSIGEKRRTQAVAADLKGKAVIAGVTHDLAFGVLRSTARESLPDYAYNFAGTGDITGASDAGPVPDVWAGSGSTRDERSLEFSVRDTIRWNERLSTWLGVRHTRLNRASIEGDTTGLAGYRQSFTTPWVALGYKLTPDTLAYASWGQGVESTSVPNNAAVFANHGAVLPALKSRQVELGLKGASGAWTWQVDAFDIRRPLTNFTTCVPDATALCTGRIDGTARHRGIEAGVNWNGGTWRAGASTMLLRARREGSTQDAALNGRPPVNVPSFIARAHAAWRIAAVPGLEVQGALSHEGRRAVVPDESVMLPAWTRLDAALRYERTIGNASTTWVLGVDNLANRRYWREAPAQFGHIWLYPGAPRTVRLSMTASL